MSRSSAHHKSLFCLYFGYVMNFRFNEYSGIHKGTRTTRVIDPKITRLSYTAENSR